MNYIIILSTIIIILFLIIIYLIYSCNIKQKVQLMEPLMPDLEKKTFYKYLDKATNYLEYGSGGSTIQALSRNNIKYIASVESDKDWYNMINDIYTKELNKNKIFIYNYIEFNALPNTYGYPINASNNNIFQYVNIIKNSKNIDLILIDGRFRVACALYCLNYIDDNCIVIIDDMVGRDYYNIIYDYYNIIEIAGRIVVFKKKNIIPDVSILQNYLNDPR